MLVIFLIAHHGPPCVRSLSQPSAERPKIEEEPTGFSLHVAIQLWTGEQARGVSPWASLRDRFDCEARQGDSGYEILEGPRCCHFIGSFGEPKDILADRANVAAPFYVLGQSFIKYLVQHAGLAAITQLYEEHFNGTRPIADDVKRITGKDLVRWRTEWLSAIGGSRWSPRTPSRKKQLPIPAIVMPSGLSDEGLPLIVRVIGQPKPKEDETLLAIGAMPGKLWRVKPAETIC
jgi:hypothetical protein